MNETLSHTSFDMRWAVDPTSAAAMDTAALRANFLVEKLFEPGKILLSYTHYDRMVVGGAMPVDGNTLALTPVKPMGTKSFLERRDPEGVGAGYTNEILSLISDSTQQNSYSWPLYIELRGTNHPARPHCCCPPLLSPHSP